MDTFLRFAFLPFVLAGAYRYVSSKRQELPWYDLQSLSTIRLAIYGFCVALALVSLWHVVLRRRCPQCHSVSPHFADEREIERFVGTKK